MKKNCIIFLLSFIITVTALGFSGVFKSAEQNGYNAEFLRIHIRADSNEQEAQAVKYLVRDQIVDYLTPVVADCESKSEALVRVQQNLSGLENAANRVLSNSGFPYGAKARLTVEEFPTRVYGEYTLPAGSYSALVIELGTGKGDNWWCVVYPPLCFAAPRGGNVVYKSKILEIIESWKNG